jgi:hypothetical protein
MSAAKLSRRAFLAIGGGAAAASVAGAGSVPAEDGPSRPSSRVVLVRSPDVLREDGQVVPEVLHQMLNQAVAGLFSESSDAAWRRLVAPEDVVAVKSNAWGSLPTPAALEEAIRAEVIGAGVKADNVAVDDRGARSNPVFLRATAIINTRPMRTHHWAGLGTCLKNMIMYVPRPQEYHGDACAPLGAIWHLPELEGKVRLNVLVMLTPQFHGVGPHSFSRDFVWPYRGLIVGTDPVAVDATGARIIEAKRRLHFGEDRPITPPPHHIRVADERYGLGVSDPDRIEIVRIGPMDDALI